MGQRAAMVFAPWPVDESLIAVGSCYTLLKYLTLLPEESAVDLVMLGLALGYAGYFVVPGFISKSGLILAYSGKQPAAKPFFSWKLYYCLCASESATPVVCAVICYDAGSTGECGGVRKILYSDVVRSRVCGHLDIPVCTHVCHAGCAAT